MQILPFKYLVKVAFINFVHSEILEASLRSIVAEIRHVLSFGMSLVASFPFVVKSSLNFFRQFHHLDARARITKNTFAVALVTIDCLELYFLRASIFLSSLFLIWTP